VDIFAQNRFETRVSLVMVKLSAQFADSNVQSRQLFQDHLDIENIEM
jgi:hypothetical protein